MSMLISEKYSDSLSRINYTSEYDIRVHAVQSIILILYSDYLTDLNLNEINFGYYCYVTECLIKEFQNINGLNVTGTLDEVTWNEIHDKFKILKKSAIIQTGPKRITVINIDSLLSDYIVKDNINNDNSLSEYIEGGGLSYNTSIGYENLDGGINFIEYLKAYEIYGQDTSLSNLAYTDLNGGKYFDELAYNYIVSGGSVYNNVSFGYNIGNGGESWHDKYLTPLKYNVSGSSNRDYDYIYNLLSNTIYEGNVDLSPINVSYSSNDIGKFAGKYGTSNNDTFFSNSGYKDPYFSNNVGTLRKSRFDIEIVYGAKGSKSRKILDVIPMSISQEVDASGEPIYDVYEFIARDVVDGVR